MFNLVAGHAIAVLSGGLDSTAALHVALERGINVKAAIGFDYGQKHYKELGYAAATAERLGIPFHAINIRTLTQFLDVSTLLATNEEEIPEGHYAEENMKSTVVPNRNMIMMAIAGGALPKYNANTLILGVHGGDHFIYPDCRPKFIRDFNYALISSLDEEVNVFTPFIFTDKTDAVEQGVRAGMELHRTWSCYKGGDIHCGRCATCVERLEAIHDARMQDFDKTEYADDTYWKQVVADRKAAN